MTLMALPEEVLKWKRSGRVGLVDSDLADDWGGAAERRQRREHTQLGSGGWGHVDGKVMDLEEKLLLSFSRGPSLPFPHAPQK